MAINHEPISNTEQTAIIERVAEGVSRAVRVAITARDNMDGYKTCPQCKKELIAESPNMARRYGRDATKIVVNLYEAGAWTGTEHYHLACYKEAGAPAGDPIDGRVVVRNSATREPYDDADNEYLVFADDLGEEPLDELELS